MKKTKKQMFNEMLAIEAIASNTEMVEFINHEIALLEKKRTSGTATAKQVANVNVKNEIVEILTNSEKPITITEITKELGEIYSNQKISALTTQLVKEGTAKREVVKKVAYFTI